MNMHAFTEYVRYRIGAKALHGVHSPFAYALNERLLTGTKPVPRTQPVTEHLPERSMALLAILCDHLKITEVCPEPFISAALQGPQAFIFSSSAPMQWQANAEKLVPQGREDPIMIFPGIHRTRLHTTSWNAVRSLPEVRMSIDLYDLGLLLFRSEFKTPQHFVLKWKR